MMYHKYCHRLILKLQEEKHANMRTSINVSFAALFGEFN
jgi:hypothetical protein